MCTKAILLWHANPNLQNIQFFAQKISYLTTLAVSEHDYNNAHQYFVSQALFEYLTQGVEAACGVFDSIWTYYTDRGVHRSIDNEVLLVAYARMLYRHSAKRGVYKASIMRKMLTRSLELFPNNTILLSLFMWNEARTKIENRVRQQVNQAIERFVFVILLWRRWNMHQQEKMADLTFHTEIQTMSCGSLLSIVNFIIMCLTTETWFVPCLKGQLNVQGKSIITNK